MLTRTLRRLGVTALIAGILIAPGANPAMADQSAGFGPFDSTGDCGPSVYLTSYSLKGWACSWSSAAAGGTRTGLVIQNYGNTSRTVQVYWERWAWWDQIRGNATRTAYMGTHSMTVAANSTRTFWYPRGYVWGEGLCSQNEGCQYTGTKGHFLTSGYSSVSAYSPLQSPLTGCKDRSSGVTNWADTAWC
ncbi:hypothetical protein OHA21_12725 [Actinoplanes sp. NBC_00393]|uniref:hypothetical protein n=1 Tax=Actinoplanes sp. NBC_00393 TaxID=2975953 RepID=UPI002E23DA35